MRSVEFTHQLKTTDEQFLSHLTLPGKLDKQLKQLVQERNWPAARSLVAEHFRTRTRPRWSFYSHGSPWHETDAEGSLLEKADALLVHRFRNSWPPHQWIDLNNNTVDPDWQEGLRTASTSICRHTWLSELSTAWALTGQIVYVKKAIELLRSFVQHLPFVLDPRFEEDHDAYFGGEQDTTQMTSLRLFRWVDFLHCGAMHVRQACSDDDVFWLVKNTWFYLVQYYRLLDDELRRDNHHLADHGAVPFVIGMAFPEFQWSDEMMRVGAKVICHHFGHNLLKDGAYAEHSTNYQYHVLYHFAHPLGVAKANRFKLFSAKQIEQLRKWAEFSARAGKPDGRLPSIGDEPGRPLHHLFGSLATPMMDKSLAAMARGVGVIPGTHKTATSADAARAIAKWKPGTRFDFALSEYYTTDRSKLSPKKLSIIPTKQYPQGGYTFFRSAWSPDADYLGVSHFSGDYGGHAHWDPMGFVLHTQGKTLIGEPASWLYVSKRFHGHGGDVRREKKAEDLLYRGYSYSVNAHNCLVMNDDTLKPLEAMNHGTFWGGWPPKHGLGIFQAGGAIEVAEVWHNANAPTRHRRFFVHVVGIGFVFVDLLSKRTNLAPHQYSQYFHFEGGVKLSTESPANGGSLQATDDPAACLIVPGAETESRWRTWRDPYLDDLYGVRQQGGPPYVAELTRRVRGAGVFTNFVLTRSAARTPNARCQYLGAKPSEWLDWQRDAISANRLDLGEAGSLLVASAPYRTPVDSPDISTDAELAVVHLNASGRVESWCLARGKRLVIAGKSLARGAKREWASG